MKSLRLHRLYLCLHEDVGKVEQTNLSQKSTSSTRSLRRSVAAASFIYNSTPTIQQTFSVFINFGVSIDQRNRSIIDQQPDFSYQFAPKHIASSRIKPPRILIESHQIKSNAVLHLSSFYTLGLNAYYVLNTRIHLSVG